MVRTILFLRCGAAGLLGGLFLLINRSMGMQWQGLGLIGVGAASIAIWHFGIGAYDPDKPRKPSGPSFEVDDPEASNLAPTAAHLVRKIRRPRDSDERPDGGV